jgi:hypothetical protein
MDLPSIPTDSFYKFFSISGLAGSIFFLALGSKAVNELGSQNFDIELQLEKAQIEVNYLSQEADVARALRKHVNQQIQSLEAELPTLDSKRKTDKAFVRESVAQIESGLRESKDLQRKLLSALKEQDLKRAEMKVGLKRLVDNGRRTRQLINFIMFWSISLGLQAAWGFIMWYLKIQLPQDRILQNEAAGLSMKKGGKVRASDSEDELSRTKKETDAIPP